AGTNDPRASSLLVLTFPKSLAPPNCTSNICAAAWALSATCEERHFKRLCRSLLENITGWFSVLSQRFHPAMTVKVESSPRSYFAASRTDLPLAFDERRK